MVANKSVVTLDAMDVGNHCFVEELNTGALSGKQFLDEVDVLNTFFDKAVTMANKDQLDLNTEANRWLHEKGKYCRVCQH
jgi:hypothetical protein